LSRYVKYGQETGTYGSGTGTTYAIKATASNHTYDRSVQYEETLDSYTYNDGFAGGLKLTGSLEGSLRPHQMELLFHSLLGVKTDVTTAYEYTLGKPLAGVLAVGDINSSATGVERVFNGVGLKSCSLTFESKEFAKASFDWVARNYVDGAFSQPLSTEYITEDPVVFWRANVSIGGVPAATIKSINIDIDRKLDEEQFTLGTFLLNGLVMTGVSEIGGSISFTEGEFAEFNRAIAGSTSATTVGSDNPLGRTSITIELCKLDGTSVVTISMPVSIYTNATHNLSGKSEAERSVEYKAVGSGFKISIVKVTP
jgi:hypothetical protein